MIIERLGVNKLTVTEVEQSYNREIPPPTRASASVGVAKRRERGRESKSHTHLPPEASCWCVEASCSEFSRLPVLKASKIYMGLNIDPQLTQH